MRVEYALKRALSLYCRCRDIANSTVSNSPETKVCIQFIKLENKGPYVFVTKSCLIFHVNVRYQIISIEKHFFSSFLVSVESNIKLGKENINFQHKNIYSSQGFEILSRICQQRLHGCFFFARRPSQIR